MPEQPSLLRPKWPYDSNCPGQKLNAPRHTAPRGVQKSKFEYAVFGLKPSYLMLTIMFEPKNMDASTLGLKN